MRLILSSRHPRNSTYSTEAGQILYKVDKPAKVTCSVATIRKALSADDDLWRGKLDSKTTIESYYDDSDEIMEKDAQEKDSKRRSLDSVDAPCTHSDSENETSLGPCMDDLPVLEDNFCFQAQVEFHTFRASRFHYDNLDVPVSEFFHKEGWSWYGRGRVFRATNGEEYRWNLRAGYIEMVKKDEPKKELVRFREYRPSLGPIMKGRPATLEVDESCVPMLDEIMMTFIYCQKLRKDREREERRRALSGG